MFTRLAIPTLIGLLFATPLFLLPVVQWKLFSRWRRRTGQEDYACGVSTSAMLIAVSVLGLPLAWVVFGFAWTLYGNLLYASFAIVLEASIGIVAGIVSTVIWRMRPN